jgi:orotidine-5'-phosphate decarboxylase
VTYKEKLKESAQRVGNCVCMGLDPIQSALPYQSGNVGEDLKRFFNELLGGMVKQNLSPAAFKPNIGYYTLFDAPRRGEFMGSAALGELFNLLEEAFPGIPVILDSKRGDIALSSANYASEAFDLYQSDAVTVSPYMGSDSVAPFGERGGEGKGFYLLNRTSNVGAKDFQGLNVVDQVDEKEIYPLYMAVAHRIGRYGEKWGNVGAVVGATSLTELEELAAYYASREIPLLIPGVGSQGGSATETTTILREVEYPLYLARINSSSGLTHPWKGGAVPKEWLNLSLANLATLIEECAL